MSESTPLINRSHVRQYILDHASKTRAHPWDRVAGSIFIEAEAHLKAFLRERVRQMPSKGKTIS